MDRQPALTRDSSAAVPVAVARPVLGGVAAAVAASRWTQLVLGVAAMVTIAGPQYVWTLFTGPLTQAHGTNLVIKKADLLARIRDGRSGKIAASGDATDED